MLCSYDFGFDVTDKMGKKLLFGAPFLTDEHGCVFSDKKMVELSQSIGGFSLKWCILPKLTYLRM